MWSARKLYIVRQIMIALIRVANNKETKYGTLNKGDEDESPPQANNFLGVNWVARCI